MTTTKQTRRSAPESPGLRGAVYLWHEGVLFLGTGIQNEKHCHFTASLNFGLDGTFLFDAEGMQPRRMRAVAVAPNVTQSIDSTDVRLVSMQIDPETEAYGRLARIFAEQGEVVEIPDQIADELIVAAAAMEAMPNFDPECLWAQALDLVAGKWLLPNVLDPRVARALDILKRDFPDLPSAGAIASEVGLSAGRFIHLWKAQMGISLRRYILWLRLRHVIFCISIGQSLTHAAHESGFADSAHLSRTFRSMFGMPLSSLFGTNTGVQLLIKFPEEELSGPHGPYDRVRWETAAKIMRRSPEVGDSSALTWSPVRTRDN